MTDYDANTDPSPSDWLAMSPAHRRTLVRAHHPNESDALHPAPYRADFHTALHVVVEDWLATGDPPAVRDALARLTADGLRRHAAIHAIIDAALPVMTQDAAALTRALASLTAADFIAKRL